MQKLKQCVLFYLIPFFLLLSFALLMNTAGYLQRSLFPEFPEISLKLESSIKARDWSAARQLTGDLTAVWRQANRHLQLAAEKDKLEELDENMARLAALVETEDASALSELYAAANNWLNISR